MPIADSEQIAAPGSRTCDDDEEEEEEEEVEQVLDKRGEGAAAVYLLKWKGHDEETWEPARMLQGCRAHVAQFEASRQQQTATGSVAGKARAVEASRCSPSPAKPKPKRGPVSNKHERDGTAAQREVLLRRVDPPPHWLLDDDREVHI